MVTCQVCDGEFVEDDTWYCNRCNNTYCNDCRVDRLIECGDCGDYCCPDCRFDCPDCHRAICNGCGHFEILDAEGVQVCVDCGKIRRTVAAEEAETEDEEGANA